MILMDPGHPDSAYLMAKYSSYYPGCYKIGPPLTTAVMAEIHILRSKKGKAAFLFFFESSWSLFANGFPHQAEGIVSLSFFCSCFYFQIF